MDYKEIIKKVDHTNLRQTATELDILMLCEQANTFNTASVCVQPCYVNFVKQNFKNLNVCTVIGFPNGYNTTKTKLFECDNSIKNGADEIDFVINLTDVKNNNFSKVFNDLKLARKVTKNKILKIIVETCLLTEQEKITLCKICYDVGAEFIKTSTGFSHSGATVQDVLLFKKTCPTLKVKASGGINDFNFAKELIVSGAERLGTSKLIDLYINLEKNV